MRTRLPHSLLAGWLALLATPASHADSGVAAMQWQRRVLIVSTADAADGDYRSQLHALATWRGSQARDLSVVRIEGQVVLGSSDSAASLRARYQVPATGFHATLIGKDGGVKLQSEAPVTAARLEALIDAMPMRRAGQR